MTLDGWSSLARDPYLGVTVHWVHSMPESPTEWSLRTLLLAFQEVKGNHSGENLAKIVMEIFNEAGLSHKVCHDPSHGGFYMAEGTLYIRIGLPPHVVSGDRLVSSRCGLTARYLCCHCAYPMSRDWGCISTSYRSPYVLPFVYAALRAILLPTIGSADMVLRIP